MSSCTKGPECILTENARYVKFIGCEAAGQNKYLTPQGVKLVNSQDIEVDHCEIHNTIVGLQINSCTDVDITHNKIYTTSQSAINQGTGGDTNTLVESNNCYDGYYDTGDDYCPRASGQTPHGSGFAIRSSDTTVRGNIFHNGWSSYGIGFYTDTTQHFDNITIENNLIYDLYSVYIIC